MFLEVCFSVPSSPISSFAGLIFHRRTAAAFLEFHDILAAFLDPAKQNGNDTLLTSNEVYHNYVRCDVRFRQPAT